MKKSILFSATALLAGSLIAADSSPKDDVTAAAKKLGEKANYSWKTTVVVPEDAQFKPGPTDGKTEKDGFTHVTLSIFDNTMQIVKKGDKTAFTNQEGAWQSLAEADNAEGPGRFIGNMVRNLKTPAAQAADLVAGAKEIKKEGDAFSSDLTDAGAKSLFTFGNVNNAKGSVKFWLKDGALVKYEFKAKGTANFNGNDVEIDRTTTVEIKDIGATKLEVPEEAKKKLS